MGVISSKYDREYLITASELSMPQDFPGVTSRIVLADDEAAELTANQTRIVISALGTPLDEYLNANLEWLQDVLISKAVYAEPMTARVPWPLGYKCGEQSQLALRINFQAGERDKNMSEEQKKSSSKFMQELDLWTEEEILRPLFATDPNQDDWQSVEERVKKAIREKVLQSYKNGRATRMGGNAPENLPRGRRYPVPMRQR